MSLTLGNPARAHSNRAAKRLLKLAVILLGAGLQLDIILHVGRSSLGVTLVSITLTMLLGALLGRALKVDRATSALISGGTAICGGSAIAALAPSLRATEAQTAIALLVVFVLNALGLFLFPPLGELIGLSEAEFGLWAALAIHDTSSVVGAATAYGGVAVAVATTVKLTRALWILPLSFVSARLYGARSSAQVPWFLFGFLGLAALRALCAEGLGGAEGAELLDLFKLLSLAGKRLMVSTLFLIGAGLSVTELRRLGARPLILAFTLWVFVSLGALWLISSGLLHAPEVG
jgi:uncharacterized integral membrane protein (TIGR00698 family)